MDYKMSMNSRTEEYYNRFIELQEKLRKSEEERLKLEMKFNEMVRVTREEEQVHYRKLRAQYKRFLEEDRRRQDRNERILRTLERIDSRVAVLMAKTERFKLLRQQYQIYLDRVYKTNQQKKTEAPQMPKEPAGERKTDADDKTDIVQTYLQNLSSNKLREMLRKEEESRPRLPITITTDTDQKYNYSDLYSFNDGELRPNYANTIADDIMHSIYSRHSRPSDTKLRQSREFNNNSMSASENKFETQPLKNYGGTSMGKYSTDFKPHDDTKNIVLAPEDTETDDFSESEEILYKNPSEFNKTKLQDSSMMEKIKPIPLDKNSTALNKTETNLISNDTVNDLHGKKLKEKMFVPVPSEMSHTENNVGSIKVEDLMEKKFANQNVVPQNPPTENIPYDNKREPIGNQTLAQGDISQKDEILLNPTTETNFNQSKEETTNSQKIDESDISHGKKAIVEPKEAEIGHIPDQIQNAKLSKDQFKKQPFDEQQLVQKPHAETIRKPSIQNPLEGTDEVKAEEKPQQTREQPQSELPTQQNLDDGQPQQIQQQLSEQLPRQQFVESEQAITAPTHYDEINNKILVQDNTEQSLQQYDENVPSASYDQYNRPVYSESDQLYTQYDENAPPVQQYDDQGQFLQQYDESGQPVETYDDNPQAIQQYDETGQPIGQYTESPQQIQQYDEQGQPIQQFDQHGEYDVQNQYLQQYGGAQYDEQGQLIPQYDEHGQLIPQYDQHGQLIQQYDENGQLLQQYDAQYGENQQPLQQYDENGQLIQSYDYGEGSQPQYDENGQLIQDQQYYGQEYEQSIVPADDQQNVAPVSQEVAASNKNDVKENKEEPKRTSNVMEMLDTDTESLKQDTKISHDSDFDFSNG